MFYSTQILARKGPLGIVWIAAHMDKGLKRNQVCSIHRYPGAWHDQHQPLRMLCCCGVQVTTADRLRPNLERNQLGPVLTLQESLALSQVSHRGICHAFR